jgi:hypothetical protein
VYGSQECSEPADATASDKDNTLRGRSHGGRVGAQRRCCLYRLASWRGCSDVSHVCNMHWPSDKSDQAVRDVGG